MQFITQSPIIISVMGPHADENPQEIFARKIKDIKECGKTFWLIKSHKAKPEMVQSFCEKTGNNKDYCIFIEPSFPGGAAPTKNSNKAKEFSIDKTEWQNFPQNLSPVTGKLDNSSYAVVFDELNFVDNTWVNLWDYADYNNTHAPIRILQGGSTFCALKRDMSKHPERIKSQIRKVSAIGRISSPYCVFVK